MRARITRRGTLPCLLLALVLVGGAVSTAAASGCGGQGRGPRAGAPEAPDGPPPPRTERLLAHLDLTDEQRAKIDELREEGRTAQLELRRELQRAKHALEGELLKDEPSLARARELAQEVGAIRTRLQIQRLEHRLAVRGLLTAEQRDQLAIMRTRAGRHHESHRRGPRMERGGAIHGPGWEAGRGHGCGYGHGPGRPREH